MSLKFLAVGQSFAGLRDEKSPYALKKENRLPNFDGTPRFAKPIETGPVQTDWLRPVTPSPAPEHAALVQEPKPVVEPPAKPKRGWFSFLKMGWFRTTKPKSEMVQSELTLDNVRVLRNDLADSDLELVIRKKKKKAQPVFSSSLPNNTLGRPGWSELTARLFDIGQK